MGELSDQMMSGGPELMEWGDALRKAPYLNDLIELNREFLLNMLHSVYALEDREIPYPHKKYGHLVFGRGDINEIKSSNKHSLCRYIAAIVESEFSLFGTVPYRELSSVFSAFGQDGIAERINTNGDRKRAGITDKMKHCLVWNMPEKPDHERVYSYAAVLKSDNEITGCDLSVIGERCEGMWFGCKTRGRFVGNSVSSTFEFGNGHYVYTELREEFIKAMDNEYGQHRPPIIF